MDVAVVAIGVDEPENATSKELHYAKNRRDAILGTEAALHRDRPEERSPRLQEPGQSVAAAGVYFCDQHARFFLISQRTPQQQQHPPLEISIFMFF